MDRRLDRRRAMLGGLLAAGAGRGVGLAARAQEAPGAEESGALAAGIAGAAEAFLGSLDGAGLGRANFAFGDAERRRWHWTTPQGFPRNGLPLREMGERPRGLAFDLLRASNAEAGYRKDLAIMSLQAELGNDPELYYVSVFGTPGTEPWGWRFEGHHLSRHVTVAGGRVVATPFFLGAWPTETAAGERAMAREEDAARELVLSLDAERRAEVVFRAESLTNHLTGNEPRVGPLDPVGLAAAELDGAQRGVVDEVVRTYLGGLPAEVAAPIAGRIDAAGRGEIRFGWAGSLQPRQPHYYRLQGPTFLLEFDNSRNGGTHIHSVWRDFEQDFGGEDAA